MMQASSQLDALIVGAGPTGLTMACELARHGLSCRIIDQADAPSATSKALGMTSRTLEAFEIMGVAEELVGKGVKLHGLNMYANGQRIVHVGMDELETRYPYILSLPQSETELTLEDLLSRLGRRVERSVQLMSFVQDEKGITASIRPADARHEKVCASWLIGCDGAHSAVRKGLGLPFEGSRYEEGFMLADVRLKWELPDDEGHVFFTLDGPVAVITLPQGRHRLIVGVVPESSGKDQTEGSFDQLCAIMRSRGLDWIRVSDPTWIATFRTHRRIVPSLRAGRVFLSGDVAHIHSPVGGQGMNLGIQDAHNLAWKLALVTGGAGRPVLLDSYQAERHPIAEATLDGTNVATKVVTLRNPIAQSLRNQLAGLLSSLEVMQDRLTRAVSGLILSYRRSPIVAEYRIGLLGSLMPGQSIDESAHLSGWRDFGAAPAAGDRAFDEAAVVSAGGASVRLFELLRTPEHAFLLFGGRASTTADYRKLSDIGRRIQDRYGNLIQVHLVVPSADRPDALHWDGSVLLDSGQMLHHQYGADSECVYLIRPDGYIGYRSRPADENRLLAYLETILVRRAS